MLHAIEGESTIRSANGDTGGGDLHRAGAIGGEKDDVCSR